MAEESADESAADALCWLAKADDDLAVATLILDSSVGVNWAACFHAQQAAEKALKADLVLLGIDFPQTHALERLSDLLPRPIAGAFDPEGLASLSPWSVAGRYPEDVANPSTETTRRLIAAARLVVDHVRSTLPR